VLVVRACEEGDVEVLERDLPTGAAQVHAAHWLAARCSRSTYLVAWVDDHARGVAVVNWDGPVGSGAAQAFPGVPEITHMQVAAAARGQGVGTRLVETAEAMAEAAGADRIAIGVSVDNVAARRLYERLGYAPTD
jgi:ribosomal protein S18 acetylase RimI-like enzyme